MSSPSVSYAESVLSHLEKVQQLPVEIQVGIARRVESCIKIARAAKNEAVVANIASSAMEEQAKAIGHGTMDPQWAAPAISEAWCNARLGLAKGSLNRHSAVAIIAAVESFTKKKALDRQRRA